MISFLIALAPVIPALISVAGVLLKWFGRSQETLEQYEAMVKRLNQQGILSVESHDKHMANKQAILQELRDEAAKKKADSEPKQP